jgi:hypothetical protein
MNTLGKKRRFRREYQLYENVDYAVRGEGDNYDWSKHDPSRMWETIKFLMERLDEIDDGLVDIRSWVTPSRRHEVPVAELAYKIGDRVDEIFPREYRTW